MSAAGRWRRASPAAPASSGSGGASSGAARSPTTGVLAHYRDSDLFVLPSRIAADGDRDGLPNVLMEAQSQSLACVATRLSGIPELIEDGVTGRLVPAGDRGALTRALAELMTRPARRRALAQAGALRVRRDFDCAAGIAALADRFGAR